MQQEDLSAQLNRFTISSDEETLTHSLDKTHISASPAPSIFSLPQRPQPQRPQQPQQPQQQPAVYSGDIQNRTNYIGNDTTSDWDPTAKSSWNSNHSTTQHEASDDGWGDDPPSFTAISQGTYFGFNSIMQAPDATVANSPQLNNNTQAFSRYRNVPVSFISAAADVANAKK